MSRIPAGKEGKIFTIPYTRDSIFFYPSTMSIFKIDPAVKDILILRNNNLGKSYMLTKLSRKHSLPDVKAAFSELETLGNRGVFDRMDQKYLLEIKKIRQYKINTIDIYMSHACNFSCEYCFNIGGTFGKKFKKQFMDWKTAKRTIDWFFRNNIKSMQPLTISFCGGEPLLNKEVLKRSLLYIEEKWKKRIRAPLHLVVATNGSLIRQDILKVIRSTGCQLFLSLDFNQKEHDKKRIFKNGKRSYNVILERLKYVIKKFPEIDIIVNSTVDEQSNFHDYFNRCYPGVSGDKIKRHFNVEFGIDHDNKQASSLFFKKIERFLKEAYLKAMKGDGIFDHMDKESFTSFNNRRNTYFNRCVCGAGLIKAGIAADGGIYICGLAMGEKKWKIGSVFSEVSRKKIKMLLKRYNGIREIRIRHCRACWARATCAGICIIGYSSDISKMSYILPEVMKPSMCKLARLFLEYGIKSYVSLGPKDVLKYFNDIQYRGNGNDIGIKDKIKLSFLIRDLINKNLKHIQLLNPLSSGS